MAKEDEILTRYLSDNERYADLINGVSFGGRSVVKPEDLSDRDSKTGYHKGEKNIKGKQNIKYRDLFRKASFGANFTVIGVENQNQVHYLMPIRCMEYDVKEYQRQVVEKKKKLTQEVKEGKNISEAEFLSGFCKEEKLNPCITFVLFYGDNWDGSADVYGLLDFTNIPEELKSMVGNYKINLVDIKKLEYTDMFHTDIKQVFDFIRYEKNKEKLEELLANEPKYRSLARDAYDVIAAFTKSKELIQIEEDVEGECVDMCKALQDWAAEERMKGKMEGKLENLRAIINNLKLSAEKAMEVLDIPPEEREQYLELI